MPEIERTNTLIVGAGPAGLAVGACLRRANVPFLILEQDGQVAAAWRRHYDRLRLHTDGRLSTLPYLPWPEDTPRYPSRQDVVVYLEAYAARFKLAPRCGQQVLSAAPAPGGWLVRTADAEHWARNLVVATGLNHLPNRPAWPGQDTYRGRVLHSAEYRDGAPFAGQDVLVVGLGNSGGEIAIDLWEHGARPDLAVRGPVNIVPRDILGRNFLYTAIRMRRLPTALTDALAAPIARATFGDVRRLGLQKPPYGPNRQIREVKKVPVIDVGTVRLIRQGKVRVRPGIACFTPSGVEFMDGSAGRYEAVVLATGYLPGVKSFLKGADAALDAAGAPLTSGRSSGVSGLYFCGFHVATTGALREIGLEARQIAAAIVTQ